MVKQKPEAEYAGFGIRFIAAIIDGIFSVVVFGVGWVINVILVWKYGYSVGKKVLSMKIIKEDNSELTITDAIIREIVGKIISAVVLCIGFLWIIFDKKKQGWHDKIAKTLVVKA